MASLDRPRQTLSIISGPIKVLVWAGLTTRSRPRQHSNKSTSKIFDLDCGALLSLSLSLSLPAPNKTERERGWERMRVAVISGRRLANNNFPLHPAPFSYFLPILNFPKFSLPILKQILHKNSFFCKTKILLNINKITFRLAKFHLNIHKSCK